MSDLTPSPNNMVSGDMNDLVARKFELWLSLHGLELIPSLLQPTPEIPSYLVVPTTETMARAGALPDAPGTEGN